MEKLLECKNITVEFDVKYFNEDKILKAVDNVNLDIYKGEMLGIIGESGSGKSTLASAILNLVREPGRISTGEVVYFNGVNLLSLSENEYNKYRWKDISTVFQAAQNALNPIITIKEHFVETYITHVHKVSNEVMMKRIKELLDFVRLDEKVLDSYPFELSGGMKQRVLIALSLLLEPKLIILDEPTTALDVITQWYILEILRKINKEKGISIVFLTHDISIIGSMVDRIAVMYAGELVEVGDVLEVYETPKHPYTKALLYAIPSLHDDITTRKSIKGAPINMLDLKNECRFKSRCIYMNKVGCSGTDENSKELIRINDNHYSRCKYWEEI
ncbi:ABC transporter ATP-binding protein [Clostridium gasigenes]|uniref:ABC transporter ATP-binding protein n=1 Tax=Clostridium gasigenes TaxID=94869 RepID=UPI0014386345|nr:ABC transporter ATP-binding protein [Clostridium gasigenes]MBB6622099.1 ABC transporter ATP-binding protein [Clostridium gasigenes]MBU3086938.1 ABC transporter ATP-binding protein [Clostridium gasigenes]MBU3131248.1 ABC transporter ATP-binding protein [Clostridium gasigenes]NKF08151.1 ABC transporter ATP-binding protein [Clostridium gasigenes]QSW18498.1 ABC transporter ATP-binding protein [Clostridium gasigenes]